METMMPNASATFLVYVMFFCHWTLEEANTALKKITFLHS